MELLKQEQWPGADLDAIPQSETMQQSSILIPALATVGPAEGSHAICAQGRVVLQRVLNRILEPPSTQIPAMLTDKRLDLAWPDAIPPYILYIGAKRCRVAKQRLA